LSLLFLAPASFGSNECAIRPPTYQRFYLSMSPNGAMTRARMPEPIDRLLQNDTDDDGHNAKGKVADVTHAAVLDVTEFEASNDEAVADDSDKRDDTNHAESSSNDEDDELAIGSLADAARSRIRSATVYGQERQDLLEMVEKKLQKVEKPEGIDAEQVTTLDRPDIILLSGVSGSGKSTLARSLKQSIEEDNEGCFISGKIDQFQQQHQSNPLITSVSQAVERLAGDSSFRAEVREQFGGDVSVLMRTIPALSAVLRASYLVPTCHLSEDDSGDRQEAGDAKTRFRRVYCRLLNIICKHCGHVVLFIDDLQWANSETFDLLTEVVMNDELLKGLVVVAACRAVTQDHSLCKYLRQLDESGVIIQDIVLSNISLDGQSSHLAKILEIAQEEARCLSEMVYPYTGGNFFSIRQVLNLLLEEELLSLRKGRWTWNEDDIRAHLYCDDIVQFVTERLRAQSSYCQDVLAVASCLGASFDGHTLESSLTSTQKKINLDEIMLDLENRSFLVRQGTNWSFAHDQVQQAAYSLIPDEGKDRFHLATGRRLLRNLTSEDLDSKLLLVASQLRRGVTLVVQDDERLALAEFFLRAGKKAAQLSQFDDASGLYGVGMDLLPSDRWRTSYDLCLELYNACAEVEYVRANFDRLIELLDTVLSNARAFSDKLRSYTTKIYALGTQNRLKEAIEIGAMVLKELDEPLPKRTTMRSILFEYYRTRMMFKRLSEDDFVRLTPMSDPTKLAAVRIMTIIISYLYWSGGPLTAYLSIRVVQLSIKYGISHMTAVGLAFYGGLVCALGAIDHGRMLGELALKVTNRFNEREWKCRVICVSTNNVLLWSSSIRDLPKSLETATQLGLDSGDIEFALLSAGLEILTRLDRWDNIQETLKAWRHTLAMMDRHRQTALRTLFSVGAQLTANLAGEGESDHPWVLTGEFMNERDAVDEALAAENVRAWGMIFSMKGYAACMFNEFDEVLRAFYMLNKHTNLEEFLHPTIVAFHDLFVGLASLLGPTRPNYRRARRRLKRLRKLAFHAPYSNLARAFLLEGEIAAQKGSVKQAMVNFEASIAVAQKEEAMNTHVMVLERQGCLMEASGRPQEAIRSLRRARTLCEEWGCAVKVSQLDEILSRKAFATSLQATSQSSTIALDTSNEDIGTIF